MRPLLMLTAYLWIKYPWGKNLHSYLEMKKRGLSNYAFNEADACLGLPMYGFTQSYNISVSVAITFSHVIERLRASKVKWKLSEKEKRESKTVSWYEKSSPGRKND